jgi:hypothetical protein
MAATSQVGSKPLTEFALFPDLPVELRLKIFKIAHLADSEDRVVEVTFELSIMDLISPIPAPALLSVRQ